MRKPILAGNWKMNKTVAEAVALVAAMKDELCQLESVERVLCPPFMAIPEVARLVARPPTGSGASPRTGSGVGVGAQDMYWKDAGAFTGEVSPLMVKEFCSHVIIGHSERREHFGESDESVNLKLKAALAHGLVPIVCVGETLALRQEGRTEAWVAGQVRAALAGLSAEQVGRVVIAYEPIWAIGTGLAATAAEAQRVCKEVVRVTVAELYGPAVAQGMRIQYGGSVTPANAPELMAQPDIDGALVGGASLKAGDFVAIVRAASEAK